MDSRWFQGKIEEYSFLKLAQKILPQSEFPIVSYPYVKESLQFGMESVRKNMSPRFHYITKEEELAIFNDTWDNKRDYENEEMKYGFYFPDVPIGYLESYFTSWFKDKYVDEMLKTYYTEKDGSIYFPKRSLVIAVFCIWHEYGHYLDYKKRKSKMEYAQWIYESKAPFREYEKKIEELKETGSLTAEAYEVRNKIYRECVDEHSADIYALNNLSEKVSEAFEIIWKKDEKEE